MFWPGTAYGPKKEPKSNPVQARSGLDSPMIIPAWLVQTTEPVRVKENWVFKAYGMNSLQILGVQGGLSLIQSKCAIGQRSLSYLTRKGNFFYWRLRPIHTLRGGRSRSCWLQHRVPDMVVDFAWHFLLISIGSDMFWLDFFILVSAIWGQALVLTIFG